MSKKKRVGFYIDGYNLYCALTEAQLYDFIWLNVHELCQHLCLNGKEYIAVIRYFTTFPYWNPAKSHRHKHYVRALTAMSSLVKPVIGRFQEKEIACHRCNGTFFRHVEKRTDVGVASWISHDLIKENLDVVYVISADSDFIPIFERMMIAHPAVERKIWFPPHRGHRTKHLRASVNWAMTIPDELIGACQLPNPVHHPTKGDFHKPEHWSDKGRTDELAGRLREHFGI